MADFRIDIIVSGRQAAAGIQDVESSLERLNRTAASTNSLLRSALQVAGVGTAAILVRKFVTELVTLSDTYTQIQNRLGAVTEGTAALESVTGRLLEVANATRSGFEATAQLYQRTALATKDLGTSQEELLGITQTVNQAILLSGASTKEASNGLIQLSQAIAANRLGGDELRSVLEQLPVVADLIARRLGVTRGQLRQFGADGKITADVILGAFRDAREEIGERFAATVPTIGQSLQVLQNNLINFVGEFNKTTGLFTVAAGALQLVAQNLELIGLVLVALAGRFAAVPLVLFTQRLVTGAAAATAFNFATLGATASVQTFFTVLTRNPVGILVLAVGSLVVALGGLGQALSIVQDGLGAVAEGTRNLLGFLSGLVMRLTGSAHVARDVQAALLVLSSTMLALSATNPFTAALAAAGALVVAIGRVSVEYDKYLARLEEEGRLLAAGTVSERLERAQARLRDLTDLQERGIGGRALESELDKVRVKVVQLQAEYDKLHRARQEAADPILEETNKLKELIRSAGLSRREREVELELQKRVKALAEKQIVVVPGSAQEQALRDLIQQKQATEELADALDEIRAPAEDARRLIQQVFDAEGLDPREVSSLLNKLFADLRRANPLGEMLAELQEQRQQLEESVTTGPPAPAGTVSGDLAALQAARREAEVQAELRERLRSLRDEGVATQDIAAQAAGIENDIRLNNELARQIELRKELLGLQQQRRNEGAVALLPEFEQGVQRQIQALERLDEVIEDPAAEAALIRRNALLQEFGAGLNNLQSPLLAQAQAQQQVADQIARTNELMATGAITAEQYALRMADLDFQARSVSTSFGDGFTSALERMVASINDATIAQTTLTAGINAAKAATSEFVQQGTVDFRRLALNIIDAVAQAITELLVLKAIQAATGFFGGGPVGFEGLPEQRQHGGTARANQPFVVGERGPELFVPGRTGTVVPNDQVVSALSRAGGGGAAPVVVPAPAVNVSITNVTDPNEILDVMESDAGGRRIMNQISRNPGQARRSLGS